MKVIYFFKNIFTQVVKGNFKVLKYCKYYKNWKQSLLPKHNSIIDQQAWLAYPAIDFLQKNVQIDAKIFEYGAGGSTLFFLQKSKNVVTVEHDAEWFYRLNTIIKEKQIENWDGNHIIAEPIADDIELSISDPDHYYSNDPQFKNSIFRNYATFIEKFPNDYFDIILIDGRARTSCLKHSMSKLRTGGYLILDNSERNYYTKQQKKRIAKEFNSILNSFAPFPYITCFSKTSIWKKK